MKIFSLFFQWKAFQKRFFEKTPIDLFKHVAFEISNIKVGFY